MAKINFKKIQSRAMSVAGLVAGSVASNYAGTTIENLGKGKISPLMNAGIRVIVAAALPSVVGGGKTKGFIEDFSNGMMAQAGYGVAKALGIPGISGADDMDSPISDYLPSGSVGATGGDNILSGTDN
jgi:hypothetical protein